MRVTAAVVPERGAPFRLETLDLAEPAADELIVRVVASGICQTDIHGRDAFYGTPFPCVFGHEGTGIVERVGASVRKVAVGDHVMMVSPGCGSCDPCRRRLPGYCDHARRIKMSGLLRSGAMPFSAGATRRIHGAFFQQSSFATHALATEQNTVKVRRDVSLEQLAAFPCGVNTGAGAVMHVLRPDPGSSFAVFGAGTVGIAGMLAARLAGCTTIIAVDLHAHRLALAAELGATHTIDASAADPVAAILSITGGRGAHFILEAAGHPGALRQAVDALAVGGTCCLAGSARPGTDASLEMVKVQWGRTLRGCIQGDSDPDTFMPRLVDLFADGKMPIDRLVRVYDFADINQAAADMESGRTIKAVLRIGAAP